MRYRTQFLLVLATVVAFAGMALAQQDVQITKGPIVEHTGSTNAVIAWSTSASASTVVQYGTDPNNLYQSKQAPWGGLTHRVTIENLQPGTTYHFRVTSGQGAGTGTGAIGQMGQFTTKGASNASNSNGNTRDNQFQITNGPNIENVADTSAVVAWSTDRPSSSVVKYGTDPNNLNETVQEPWGATTHRATIKNLQPGTRYYFSVHSAQGKNTPGQSADTQPIPFTTTGNAHNVSTGGGMAQNQQFRITNGPVMERVSDTNAIVAWSSDRPASSVVKYGTDRNNLNQTAQAPWGSTTHRVELKNLKPSTQYYVQVQSAQGKNAPGQQAMSSPVPFTTATSGQSAMK